MAPREVLQACCCVAGPDGQRVQLLCIPSFVTTGMLLLLNLSTLEVETVNFDTHFMD